MVGCVLEVSVFSKSHSVRRAYLPLVGALMLAGAAAAPGFAAESPAPAPAQSPINLELGLITPTSGLPALTVRYATDTTVHTRYVQKDAADPDGCSTRDAEETEEVDVAPGAGDVVVGGVTYHLQQFHFHTPSEHRVQGRQAPLEQHLVHRSDDGHLLVISVLLFPGKADEADRVFAELPQECAEVENELDHFNLRQLLPTNLSTVRYNGSLTTAPFTEGVQWFLTTPQTVSPAGIRAFRTVFPDGDSRPVQPLNGRSVVADLRWSGGLSH
jgi:carbonic anhydrase